MKREKGGQSDFSLISGEETLVLRGTAVFVIVAVPNEGFVLASRRGRRNDDWGGKLVTALTHHPTCMDGDERWRGKGEEGQKDRVRERREAEGGLIGGELIERELIKGDGKNSGLRLLSTRVEAYLCQKEHEMISVAAQWHIA